MNDAQPDFTSKALASGAAEPKWNDDEIDLARHLWINRDRREVVAPILNGTHPADARMTAFHAAVLSCRSLRTVHDHLVKADVSSSDADALVAHLDDALREPPDKAIEIAQAVALQRLEAAALAAGAAGDFKALAEAFADIKARSKPRKPLRVREPLGEDRRPLTERPWLIEKFAMRGEVTALVAPPGAGKTTLVQQIMYAASTGTEWAGMAPLRPLKVLVFHWEDDEEEMDRKVQAIEQAMGGPERPQNLKTIYCGAGDIDDDDLILATYDGRSDKFTPTLGFDDVDGIVREYRPDIIVIDPVANTFEGPEGNELLKGMTRLMRRLARRNMTAVILILHTKKYADGSMAGNMDAGRNTGTLVGRVRVGLTLFPMTAEEAEAMAIDPARRYRFVRLDDGKQSYSARDDARWFELVEIVLPLDDERALRVGTFKPWEPQSLFHGVSNQTIHAILAEIDRGVPDQDGALYQPRQNARHWVGDVILRHIPGCKTSRAKRILATWKKERLLVSTTFEDIQHKSREGLKSDPTRWPGTTS